jgi:hypothetical protein
LTVDCEEMMMKFLRNKNQRNKNQTKKERCVRNMMRNTMKEKGR